MVQFWKCAWDAANSRNFINLLWSSWQDNIGKRWRMYLRNWRFPPRRNRKDTAEKSKGKCKTWLVQRSHFRRFGGEFEEKKTRLCAVPIRMECGWWKTAGAALVDKVRTKYLREVPDHKNNRQADAFADRRKRDRLVLGTVYSVWLDETVRELA